MSSITIVIEKTNKGNLDTGYIIRKIPEHKIPEIKGRWIDELFEKLKVVLVKNGY